MILQKIINQRLMQLQLTTKKKKERPNQNKTAEKEL